MESVYRAYSNKYLQFGAAEAPAEATKEGMKDKAIKIIKSNSKFFLYWGIFVVITTGFWFMWRGVAGGILNDKYNDSKGKLPLDFLGKVLKNKKKERKKNKKTGRYGRWIPYFSDSKKADKHIDNTVKKVNTAIAFNWILFFLLGSLYLSLGKYILPPKTDEFKERGDVLVRLFYDLLGLAAIQFLITRPLSLLINNNYMHLVEINKLVNEYNAAHAESKEAKSTVTWTYILTTIFMYIFRWVLMYFIQVPKEEGAAEEGAAE